MKNNRFESYINTKHHIALSNSILNQKTTKYLLDTSLSFSGSPLNLLLNPSDIQICKEFIALMSKHNYLNSKPIFLEMKVPKKRLNLFEINQGSRHHKILNKFINGLSWKKIWLGAGYPIGVLTEPTKLFVIENTGSPVYLCTDLKLRCSRNTPVFTQGQTYTSGVGTIPSKVLDKYSFRIGKFIQSYDETNTKVFKEDSLENLFLLKAEALLEMWQH